MSSGSTPVEVELDDDPARAAWDARQVHGPGGHVYQSTTWAAQRARRGWQPRFVRLDDDRGALVLIRPNRWVGGASAYVPRGPIAGPDDDPGVITGRLARLADHLAAGGADVVASDAEIPAGDGTLHRALQDIGFRAIPEIQPSRHRVSLALPPGMDDAAARSGVSKSTRQRIDAAERSGIVIRRHDQAGWDGDHPLFDGPDRPLDTVLADFATLLEGTGQRRGFRFGPRDMFIDWWQAAHAAGLVVHLEARDDGHVLGGLLLYRHGDRLTTVHSADAPGVRERHPGVMHLLRWRAIQLAIREGRQEMDLGGVDVGPEHREPQRGDEMAGLYEHKRSFGATWVELVGAHQRVIRPWRAGLARVTARAARVIAR